jgi:hypothetical protein
MKIGMIVDGQGEFRSLAKIFRRVRTEHILLSPLYADLQPKAGTLKLVRAALPAVRVLAKKGAQRVLIILDHEDRPECVPSWRSRLEAAFNQPCKNAGVVEVRVVLKVQKYENWLISDPGAIKSMPQRFNLSNGNKSEIAPNKADRADGMRILKASAQGAEYHKVQDAVALMDKFDPYVAAGNSRSFRRFLRLLGCRSYAGQSRMPE